MCTLTWGHIEQDARSGSKSYHIHFNRDESRNRQQAIPPKLYTNKDSTYIAPIDRDALGTWIFVNCHGLTACLLNNYIVRTKASIKKQRSRGLLLRDLTSAESIRQAEQILDKAGIRNYAPFDIFLFDSQTVLNIGWDGEQQTRTQYPERFKSSSGFETKAVTGNRFNYYQAEKTDINQSRLFHRSHLPEKSAYSVCMHRPDARTQSYTEIVVHDGSATMRYSDGPPCSTELSSAVQLQLG